MFERDPDKVMIGGGGALMRSHDRVISSADLSLLGVLPPDEVDEK
jgi:hypothetical protein